MAQLEKTIRVARGGQVDNASVRTGASQTQLQRVRSVLTGVILILVKDDIDLAPLIPPLTVTAHPILLPELDSVDLLCRLPIVKIRFAAECSIRPADWPGQLSHL